MPTALEHPPSLASLFHYRWTVHVVAELSSLAGAKLVTIANRLGVARPTARATLDAAIRRAWVQRNQGHGHPMRPEYLLTPPGARLAPACIAFIGAAESIGAGELAFRKWSATCLLQILAGRARFSRIRAALPAITDRALALCLRDLEAAGMLTRNVSHDHPPVVTYALTSDGRRLARAAEALARALTP